MTPPRSLHSRRCRLPYVSYRYGDGRFSFEPSVGYLFVGMKSGLQF